MLYPNEQPENTTLDDWKQIGFRLGDTEAFDLRTAVDVVVHEHFGFVDWQQGLVWISAYHRQQHRGMQTSMKSIAQRLMSQQEAVKWIARSKPARATNCAGRGTSAPA